MGLVLLELLTNDWSSLIPDVAIDLVVHPLLLLFLVLDNVDELLDRTLHLSVRRAVAIC